MKDDAGNTIGRPTGVEFFKSMQRRDQQMRIGEHDRAGRTVDAETIDYSDVRRGAKRAGSRCCARSRCRAGRRRRERETEMMTEFMVEKKFNCAECGGRLSPSFVQWPRDSNRTDPNLFLCNKCRPRISVDVVFLTRRGAAIAIKVLRAAGYDVLVADHLADPCDDETVFAEVYGAGAGSPAVDAFWQDVQRIVDPFEGDAGIGFGCGPVDDDRVPFSYYR